MTKKSSKRKHGRRRARKSSLDAKMFQVLSGRTHRVAARTRKLTSARKKARGMVSRGAKHVSIRRGSQTIPLVASRRRRSRRKTSRRSTRRVSRNSRRRRSRRGVKRNSRRRSRRGVKRNSRRRRSRRSRR